jgi:hypothetical protein
MAPPFGWWTCLSPVAADPLVVRPVRVAQVQVAQAQVAQVQRPLVQPPQPLLLLPQARAQQGHAQALRQASLVRPLPRAPPWLDRTLA